MTPAVTEQWDHPHFFVEREGNRWEAAPFIATTCVEHEVRTMSDVSADVREVGPASRWSKKRMVLIFVDMDTRIRKVREAAAMIKMHVGEDYMPDVFGLET